MLRLDANDPMIKDDDGKRRFAAHVLEIMELTNIQNLQVGSFSEGGLTFEQRKRLSIACELAGSPSVIFLDGKRKAAWFDSRRCFHPLSTHGVSFPEPTSGLDSRGAIVVMRAMKRIADTGRTVCATIHQPSSDTFKEFDKLLLLAEGNIIYQGKARDAFDYFKGIGFVIPRFSNPADYFLKEFYVPYKPNPIVRKKLDMVYDSYDKEIKPEIMKKIDTSSKGVD